MSNGIVDSRVAVWQFVQVYYMPLIVLSRRNVTKIFFFTLKECTYFYRIHDVLTYRSSCLRARRFYLRSQLTIAFVTNNEMTLPRTSCKFSGSSQQ